MKITITTLLFIIAISTSFAQNKVQDDTYGTKSLMIQDKQTVTLKLPGLYLKKAGNNFAASMLFSLLTGIAGSQIAKNNPKNANYVYAAGGVISIGLFISGASNLSKAGEEIDKALRR
jgi:hypothetical protein